MNLKINEIDQQNLDGAIAYMVHPFNGADANMYLSLVIANDIHEHIPGIVIVNPLTNFAYMPYDKNNYRKGIDTCLALLDRCDALILTGNWKDSRGCMAEYGFAKSREIPIYELSSQGVLAFISEGAESDDAD